MQKNLRRLAKESLRPPGPGFALLQPTRPRGYNRNLPNF